jgi:hypothetical protein
METGAGIDGGEEQGMGRRGKEKQIGWKPKREETRGVDCKKEKTRGLVCNRRICVAEWRRRYVASCDDLGLPNCLRCSCVWSTLVLHGPRGTPSHSEVVLWVDIFVCVCSMGAFVSPL